MSDFKKHKRMRRGASVLIAMLVFFLALLSGALALSMSASNSGRVTHNREDQQAYLSVASAAKLILSELEGIKFIIVFSNEDAASGEAGEDKYTMDNYKENESKVKKNNVEKEDGLFGKSNAKALMRHCARLACGKTEGLDGNIKFTLALDDSSSEQVEVELETDSNADLLFTLYYNGKGQSNYQTLLKVPGRSSGTFYNGKEEVSGEGEEGTEGVTPPPAGSGESDNQFAHMTFHWETKDASYEAVTEEETEDESQVA